MVQEISCPIGEAELAKLVRLIQAALLEDHGIQAASIVLVEAMRIPTGPDGEIRRGACRWQYVDGDLIPLAQWRSPGSTESTRETNVVALTKTVVARRQRVCQP